MHAELSAIAERLDDPTLRARVRAAGCRIARATGGQDQSAPPLLSPREIDVLAQVALGCTNAEAAWQLGLQLETVKSYLAPRIPRAREPHADRRGRRRRAAGLLP